MCLVEIWFTSISSSGRNYSISFLVTSVGAVVKVGRGDGISGREEHEPESWREQYG